MIRPKRARIMGRLARRTTRKVPVRLVSMTDCQSSSDMRMSKRVLGHACVGHQDLHRAEFGLDGGERLVHLSLIRDVARDAEDAVRYAA